MTGKVYNRSNPKRPKDCIYIGRGSKYGNPYYVGSDGNREEVIFKYENYLNDCLDDGFITVDELADLYGFDLECFCKPLICHGDVLIKYINASYWLLYE